MKLKAIFTTLFFVALCGISTFAQNTKPAGPQLVRDTDNPAKQPFTKKVDSQGAVVQVPAGKVLVIESVTGLVRHENGYIGPLSMWVLDPDGTYLIQWISPSYNDPLFYATYYTQQGRFYITAGQRVELGWYGSGSPTEFHATVSGYFVNVQ